MVWWGVYWRGAGQRWQGFLAFVACVLFRLSHLHAVLVVVTVRWGGVGVRSIDRWNVSAFTVISVDRAASAWGAVREKTKEVPGSSVA